MPSVNFLCQLFLSGLPPNAPLTHDASETVLVVSSPERCMVELIRNKHSRRLLLLTPERIGLAQESGMW